MEMTRREIIPVVLACAAVAAAVASLFYRLKAASITPICSMDYVGHAALARAYRAYQMIGLCVPPSAIAAFFLGFSRTREWFVRSVIGTIRSGQRPHWGWLLGLYPLAFLTFAFAYNLPLVGGFADAFEDCIAHIFYPFVIAEEWFYPIAHCFSPAGFWGDPYLIWGFVVSLTAFVYITTRFVAFAVRLRRPKPR